MSRDFVDDEINILQQMYTANMHWCRNMRKQDQ